MLSLKDIAYWVGVAAIIIGAVVSAALGIWFALQKGRNDYWKNAASALEMSNGVLLKEKAELEAENVKLQARVAELRSEYDEAAQLNLRAAAKIEKLESKITDLERECRRN